MRVSLPDAGLAVYLVIPFREAARVLILRHSS